MFALDKQTLISIGIQFLNACILAAALSFFLYKPVRKFLLNRASGIKDQLNVAGKARSDADEMKLKYEKRMEMAESERIKILESAQADAAQKCEKMLNDAKKEISEMKARAEADIQKERERANDENTKQIIEIAAVMAEKFVAVSLDDDARNRIFDETIKEIGGLI